MHLHPQTLACLISSPHMALNPSAQSQSGPIFPWMWAIFKFHTKTGVSQRNIPVYVGHATLLQPRDLTPAVPQHSLTKSLFTSCDNAISRMRRLALSFVTVVLSICSNSGRRNTLPHRKIAWAFVSRRALLGRGWNNGSHHVLLLMAKPQLTAPRSPFLGRGYRTVCSGNMLLHPAKEAKPQIVRWTVSTFFWPQLPAEPRTVKCRDEFWSKLLLTFLSDIAKNQTWLNHKWFCRLVC